MKIYPPFSIGIDPMDRLLLINFEKDPDSIYVGYEPQVIKNTPHGESHLIILCAQNGRGSGKLDYLIFTR